MNETSSAVWWREERGRKEEEIKWGTESRAGEREMRVI